MAKNSSAKPRPNAAASSPLFYSKPVALDRQKHRGLKTGAATPDFGFARNTHFIPALIDEFSPASRSLPIVFLPGAEGPTAVFMVGLTAGRNVFVDAEGKWTGNYVPAYLRRYPFILGEAEGQDPIMMIEEGNALLSETEGEPLFTEAGEGTESLTQAIAFANEYYAAGKRTEAFMKILQDLELLTPVTIESRLPGQDGQQIHGLLSIDENKLYTMPEADFLNLRKERLLGPIFAHFFSLSQIENLRIPA